MARNVPHHLLLAAALLLLITPPVTSQSQSANLEGYVCSADRTIYPCRAYALYRASAPAFLDLAAVGDLFGVSRLSVARASNISDAEAAAPLYPDQPLLVPLSCGCGVSNRSYAAVPYRIKKGDTFYLVSTTLFRNLTTYQAVELVNPTLVPTLLDIGVEPIFPVFCQCPNVTNSTAGGGGGRANFLVTYLVQPSDSFAIVASRFGTDVGALVSLNGEKLKPFSTLLVPVSTIPIDLTRFDQGKRPGPLPAPPPGDLLPAAAPPNKRKGSGVIIGLGTAVGILVPLVLFLVLLVLKQQRSGRDGDEKGGEISARKTGRHEVSNNSASDECLLADINECLDKYRLYRIEELKQATSDFNNHYLIQGSVYKGWLDGEPFAIKRMKWNATEELRILQKVNHTNLVKLEGFCIDPEDGACYLVYEYVENGSLYSWLHDSSKSYKLNWKLRLKIALDIANGLQYIHEHTWPRVVHKDISSSNVLLDGKMRAKIANFGLARSGCNAMTTHIIGTQGYVPPEYLIDGLVTTKMDVFAYGVVLLELVSGKEAINEDGEALWMDKDGVFNGKEGIEEGMLKAWIDKTFVEQACPIESVASVMSIARACLQKDPSKRPNMVDIVYTLSKLDDSSSSDFSGEGLSVYDSGISAR